MTERQELEVQAPGSVVEIQTHPITPMEMLNAAVQQGADIDKIEKLMQLLERWEANEARKAYVKAMAAFKAEAPEISKNKKVEYKGIKYSHASLDQAADVIGQALGKHGLSHHWSTEQNEGKIKVVCHITHELGHSESVALIANYDQTGSKNAIQAIGSTITYLERYTLLAATGLAAKGQDDDGQSAEDVPRLNEEQIANIEALLDEVAPGAKRKIFLNWAEVDSVDRIRADEYDRMIKALEKKRKA